MASQTYVNIASNTYMDSVSLMSLSTKANTIEGVDQAFIAMGAPMNKEVMANVGISDPAIDAAGPGDLMVVVRFADGVDSDEDREAIVAQVHELLERRSDGSGGIGAGSENAVVYRTLDSAMRANDDANVVIISVAGQYAAREAQKALAAGKHVMMFSDNVSVEDELALKTYAHEHDLLMMGPDCGTAMINGVGLCFANAVRRGPIGIVGASGTGSQELAVRIHDFNSGVSQLIGVGGRDLSQEIGGIMMLDAIRALDADPETSVIALISKPPHPEVMARVLDAAQACSKPVVACFLGAAIDDDMRSTYSNVTFESHTKPAALAAVEAAGVDKSQLNLHALNWTLINEIREKFATEGIDRPRYIRGVFCGGTLCDEALFTTLEVCDNVYSNLQKDPSKVLGPTDASRDHTFIDMGDDAFTQGRPHPMIDPSLRNARIVEEAKDPHTAVIVLDFVLGYGSHEDPVGAALPAIEEAFSIARSESRELVIIGYVLGTDEDTPNVAEQFQKLLDAGCIDASSSTNAGLLAREFVQAADA